MNQEQFQLDLYATQFFALKVNLMHIMKDSDNLKMILPPEIFLLKDGEIGTIKIGSIAIKINISQIL